MNVYFFICNYYARIYVSDLYQMRNFNILLLDLEYAVHFRGHTDSKNRIIDFMTKIFQTIF